MRTGHPLVLAKHLMQLAAHGECKRDLAFIRCVPPNAGTTQQASAQIHAGIGRIHAAGAGTDAAERSSFCRNVFVVSAGSCLIISWIWLEIPLVALTSASVVRLTSAKTSARSHPPALVFPLWSPLFHVPADYQTLELRLPRTACWSLSVFPMSQSNPVQPLSIIRSLASVVESLRALKWIRWCSCWHAA